jgi:hypothetical protein
MRSHRANEPRINLRDVAVLALERMNHAPALLPHWPEGEGALLRREAVRILHQSGDAARLLAPEAERLVRGIELVPSVGGEGAPFGPAWPGHPFASGAMGVGYKLREADLTRELAKLMGPSAGRRGPERAISFLRVMAELAGEDAVLDALRNGARPTVTAEHMVSAGAAGLVRSAAGPAATSARAPRDQRLASISFSNGRSGPKGAKPSSWSRRSSPLLWVTDSSLPTARRPDTARRVARWR